MKNFLAILILLAIPVLVIAMSAPGHQMTRDELLPGDARERLICTYVKLLGGESHPILTTQSLALHMTLDDVREAYRRAGQTIPQGIERMERDARDGVAR